jgi:hypothetical protein
MMMSKKPKAAKPTTGVVYAIKKTKPATTYRFMPDEVIVLLDGEAKGKLLITCGWTMTTNAEDKSCKRWSITRLKANLDRIEESWIEDVSKGWRFEVRPA